MHRGVTIIITMVGIGSRFRKAGYNYPKYMIMAGRKTLFEWSLDSLVGYRDYVLKYVFVVRKEDNAAEFIRDKCRKYKIEQIELIELDYMTDGQATTCMQALSFCDLEAAILVYNIDTYVEPLELKYEDISGDGHIPCFYGEGDHWSFVKLNQKGKVTEVREKERISDYCTLGAYYFSSARLYGELYKEYYANESQVESNEKYIAPLYNLMIEKEMSVSISIVNAQKVHVLGTPEELAVFMETC